MSFKEINPKEMDFNAFSLLDDNWSLITAGTEDKFNTMTASWGSFGYMWKKPIFIAVIRPTRYTYEFIEKEDLYSVSFFDTEYKKALAFCGAHSGRDCDKIKETGLTPAFDNGVAYFEEAKFVFICKKLYIEDVKPEGFIGMPADEAYPEKNFHRAYVSEIVKVLKKD